MKSFGKKPSTGSSMSYLQTHAPVIMLVILFAFHIFFRFLFLEQRASLGWDQIDSAWAAKSIVVDHTILINGPVAKGNTGIYMGPLYYYLIAVVYFFTGMDPIASPIFAALTSVFAAGVIYWVTMQLFGRHVALIALFINTFSLGVIHRDHTQNAIQFIVPVSYLIFFFLYRVITGKTKYLPHLAVMAGISFHVDFTSVLYPLLIALTLPFFPWRSFSARQIGVAVLLFALIVSPIFLAFFQRNSTLSTNMWVLFQTYYHGFHVRRVLQIAHDAFISIENILEYRVFRPFVFLVGPVFMAVYGRARPIRETGKLYYLILLWFFVPWFVLATYKGELTSSYFSLPFDISIAMLAYLTYRMLVSGNLILRVIPMVFWTIYAVNSTVTYMNFSNGTLTEQRVSVKQAIARGEVIPFKEAHPDSFLYYLYTKIQPPN